MGSFSTRDARRRHDRGGRTLLIMARARCRQQSRDRPGSLDELETLGTPADA